MDPCGFKASLVYKASARTGFNAAQKNFLSKPLPKLKINEQINFKRKYSGRVVVEHAFNPSTQEAETGRSVLKNQKEYEFLLLKLYLFCGSIWGACMYIIAYVRMSEKHCES